MRGFLIVFGIIALTACSSNEPPRRTQSLDIKQVAQSDGLFSIVRDASMITVQVIKDESIPVKGALNFKSGKLNVKSIDSNLVLEVDMKSWDSGLTARDSNVTNVFFNVLNEANAVSQVEASLAEDVLAAFRASASLDNLKATINITFNGVTRPTEVHLSAKPDDKGRLVIQTIDKITLKISDFALGDNLVKLMALCNHKSVSDLIEISIYLVFEPDSVS